MPDSDNKNRLSSREEELISKLKQKYDNYPEEFADNLDGLVSYKGLSYWDYINVDALLGLQHTRTNFDDELIFIVYHQICELYFKLIISEIEKITNPIRKEYLLSDNWIKRIGRINNYFSKLEDSFDILSPKTKVYYNSSNSDLQKLNINCFDTDEFKKFRLALMPASGFQTIQFRKIEVMTTSLKNLVHPFKREELKKSDDLKIHFEHIYWKFGGRINDDPGPVDSVNLKKTRTLEAFETKYDEYLFELAENYKNRNIYYIFYDLKSISDYENGNLSQIRSNQDIISSLNILNHHLSTLWRGSHYGMVKSQLDEINKDMSKGTGGTNWAEYLDPNKQALNFFPEL